VQHGTGVTIHFNLVRVSLHVVEALRVICDPYHWLPKGARKLARRMFQEALRLRIFPLGRCGQLHESRSVNFRKPHEPEKKKFQPSRKNSTKYKMFVRSVAIEKTSNRSTNDSVVAENNTFEVWRRPGAPNPSFLFVAIPLA